MPESLADWYMSLSTSMLTALVHSSSKANEGLKNENNNYKYTRVRTHTHTHKYRRTTSVQIIIVMELFRDSLMVENSGERHSLFLATRQHVFPVSGRIPAAFPLHQMRQVHSGKTRFQVLFGDTFGLHVI